MNQIYLFLILNNKFPGQCLRLGGWRPDSRNDWPEHGGSAKAASAQNGMAGSRAGKVGFNWRKQHAVAIQILDTAANGEVSGREQEGWGNARVMCSAVRTLITTILCALIHMFSSNLLIFDILLFLILFFNKINFK